MSMQPLSGGCFCGAIRYQVTEVFDSGYCHCSVCRRISGAPAIAWANVLSGRFRLIRGSPRRYASSAQYERCFCAECGTHCYTIGRDDPEMVSVSTGTLDRPELVPPRVHIWTQSRLSWFDTRDDLPRFAEGTISHPDGGSR